MVFFGERGVDDSTVLVDSVVGVMDTVVLSLIFILFDLIILLRALLWGGG